MAYYTEDPRLTPDSLSGFARMSLEERPENQLVLEGWFPNATDVSTSWSSDQGSTEDFTAMASHRAFDTPSRISGRPGSKRIQGALPPIGDQKILLESEIHALQQGNISQASVDVIFNDVEALTYAVRNRKELERAQLLETGKVNIQDENGLWLEADFDRKAARTATAATMWTDVASPALAEEKAFCDLVKTDEGEEFATVLMDPALISNLGVNTGYLNASRDARAPTQIALDEINEIRGRYGLPMIVESSAKVRGLNGVVAPILNVKKAFYLPGRPVGQTRWGRPVIAGEPNIEIESNTGGPVVYLERSGSVPVHYATVIDALAMAVLAAPNVTGCLTVVA